MNLKKEQNIVKLGLILLVITASAGLILGLVFNITKEPIEKQENLTNENAMKELIKTADKFHKKDITLTGNIKEVNEAKKGSETIGYTVKTSTKGYGGSIELMVGISCEGKITGIKILSQSETPGLGANCDKPAFSNQYTDKPVEKDLEVTKSSSSDDNKILAITGATITSKAVTSGVNESVNFYKENLEGGK